MLEAKFVASVAERDVDFVLFEELSVSDEFREWMTVLVFGEPIYGEHVGAWHSLTSDALGESDLVHIFVSPAGRRYGVLIENKIDAPPQPEQGNRYRERGQRGVEQRYWDEFRTCVVAPREYLEAGQGTAAYDRQISYEELLAYFSSRRFRDARFAHKAVIVMEAIFKNRRGYQPVYSEGMTRFVEAYQALSDQKRPELKVQQAKPRPAGSTWIMFNPVGLPKGTKIYHQTTAGFVKAFFPAPATLESIESLYRSKLGKDVAIEPSGKSIAISLQVPVIEPLTQPFAACVTDVEKALDAVARIANAVAMTA